MIWLWDCQDSFHIYFCKASLTTMHIMWMWVRVASLNPSWGRIWIGGSYSYGLVAVSSCIEVKDVHSNILSHSHSQSCSNQFGFGLRLSNTRPRNNPEHPQQLPWCTVLSQKCCLLAEFCCALSRHAIPLQRDHPCNWYPTQALKLWNTHINVLWPVDMWFTTAHA